MDNLERVELDPRQRLYRADATLWVWIGYGLAQATITMLMAFDVIDTLTPAEVVTSVTLVAYVAVNEILVRPRRRNVTVGEAVTPDASSTRDPPNPDISPAG